MLLSPLLYPNTKLFLTRVYSNNSISAKNFLYTSAAVGSIRPLNPVFSTIDKQPCVPPRRVAINSGDKEKVTFAYKFGGRVNLFNIRPFAGHQFLDIQKNIRHFSSAASPKGATKSAKVLEQELYNMVVPAPDVLKRPLQLDTKILLGPGPSNPPPAVFRGMTQPLLGYLHPEFTKIMDDVKVGLQYVFQTKSPYTFCISGTGHSGMEAALNNLLEPGDKVLIAQHGLWGERAADMASRTNIHVDNMMRPPGQGFTYEEIENNIKKYKPTVFFMCHSESTTGVMQPLDGLGDLCHANDCLFLVDTVASLGGVPFSADDLHIDCVYSASQKVLGCPPGLAPITFNEKAMKKVLNRKTKPTSFYLDAKLIGNYWGCFDEPRKYHHTGPISLVYGLREALHEIVLEGLENVNDRHRDSAQRLYNGLEALGLKLLVKDPKYRLPTLTTVMVPDGVDWKKVVDHLFIKYHIDIAGGLGPTAGKIWRIGLMGYNSTFENVDKCLAALKEALAISKI